MPASQRQSQSKIATSRRKRPRLPTSALAAAPRDDNYCGVNPGTRLAFHAPSTKRTSCRCERSEAIPALPLPPRIQPRPKKRRGRTPPRWLSLWPHPTPWAARRSLSFSGVYTSRRPRCRPRISWLAAHRPRTKTGPRRGFYRPPEQPPRPPEACRCQRR